MGAVHDGGTSTRRGFLRGFSSGSLRPKPTHPAFITGGLTRYRRGQRSRFTGQPTAAPPRRPVWPPKSIGITGRKAVIRSISTFAAKDGRVLPRLQSWASSPCICELPPSAPLGLIQPSVLTVGVSWVGVSTCKQRTPQRFQTPQAWIWPVPCLSDRSPQWVRGLEGVNPVDYHAHVLRSVERTASYCTWKNTKDGAVSPPYSAPVGHSVESGGVTSVFS